MKRFFVYALLVIQHWIQAQTDTSSKNIPSKNCVSITFSYLLFNSEPNLNYERFFTEKMSITAHAGYKFPNVFGSNGAPVRMKYVGPRGSVGFRYHDHGGLFIGVIAGYSALSISNITAYSSASSYAEYYSGFSSTRVDLDAGITLGWHTKLEYRMRFEVFGNYGVRNVWGSTTYNYHHPGVDNVGGAILFYDSPLLNGFVSVQFFQLGINVGFQF